jgi:aminoglycoside phosphotransferase (APT) family kinase protein
VSKTDELRRRLTDFCSERLGRAVTIDDLSRFSGGASRETWSFVVRDGVVDRKLVLRQDPPGAPAKSERRGEVDILRAAKAAGVPVPEVLWSADTDELGSPGFVMEHIDGETIARRILREDEFAGARDIMAAQCGEIAAKIHSIDARDVPHLVAPETPPAEGVLDQYRTLLDSMGEPHPAFELALRHLSRNPPPTDRLTVVHGDYRNGNFIVGPDGIRAVLDWEITHIGDPWEDLAWVCTKSWRFKEPGEVGGFGKREDLYDAYEKESGIPVDRDAVHWWEVMSNVKWGVMTIGQAFTHLWGHVPSMELAAIGRRTVETEYDVLQMIPTTAERSARSERYR